jgi:hypothetical protein
MFVTVSEWTVRGNGNIMEHIRKYVTSEVKLVHVRPCSRMDVSFAELTFMPNVETPPKFQKYLYKQAKNGHSCCS